MSASKSHILKWRIIFFRYLNWAVRAVRFWWVSQPKTMRKSVRLCVCVHEDQLLAYRGITRTSLFLSAASPFVWLQTNMVWTKQAFLSKLDFTSLMFASFQLFLDECYCRHKTGLNSSWGVLKKWDCNMSGELPKNEPSHCNNWQKWCKQF